MLRDTGTGARHRLVCDRIWRIETRPRAVAVGTLCAVLLGLELFDRALITGDTRLESG